MSESVACARHTETKALLEVFIDECGGLEAVPASADADSTFISSLPPATIDPTLAGMWRHFKGGAYEFVTGVESSQGELVLYRDGHGGCWLRPRAMVSDLVEGDKRRFARVT